MVDQSQKAFFNERILSVFQNQSHAESILHVP
jgi:hypothetical protein